MQIKSTSGLNFTKANAIELKELKGAKNASEFTLRVGADGKVTSLEISRMLNTARASKSYKNNSDKFQFKLKSDNNGQYLTLKQQGAWSSFKGWLGVGRAEREQQRADAKNLINATLDLGQPDKAYSTKDLLKFNQAQKYQVSVMTTSSLAPKASREGDQNKSAEVTMEMLRDGNAYGGELMEDNGKSFEHLGEDASKSFVDKNASQNADLIHDEKHNSFMPRETKELISSKQLDDDGISQKNHNPDYGNEEINKFFINHIFNKQNHFSEY